MNHDFCPDCGHLLTRVASRCHFCGWSERVDHFTYRELPPDRGDDLVFALEDAVYPDRNLRV
jgi:hypothetical protein